MRGTAGTMDFTRRVQRLTTDFERQLTDLARSMAEQIVAAGVAAANEVARRSLAARGMHSERASTDSSPARPASRPAAPPAAPPAPAARPSPSPRSSARRPTAQATAPRPPRPRAKVAQRKPGLTDLRERLVQCVQRQPGLGLEELNRALGTTAEEVQHPLRMLLTRGVLRAEGEPHELRYFPQSRGWAASRPPRRR